MDQWSRYMMGGGYTGAIKMGDYMVETQEDATDMRFLLWNPTRPCIAMVIDKRDHIASIDSIEYSPTCTVDGKMKRGEGTRAMVDFALKLMKASGAERVQLSDNSSVMCEGIKIRLGLMSFFRTGETWYEKHFGFYPEAKYAGQYANAKEIQKTLGLSEKPCTYFTDDILDELVVRTKLVFLSRVVWEKKL